MPPSVAARPSFRRLIVPRAGGGRRPHGTRRWRPHVV